MAANGLAQIFAKSVGVQLIRGQSGRILAGASEVGGWIASLQEWAEEGGRTLCHGGTDLQDTYLGQLPPEWFQMASKEDRQRMRRTNIRCWGDIVVEEEGEETTGLASEEGWSGPPIHEWLRRTPALALPCKGDMPMQVGQMYVEPDGIDGRESVIELLGETHGEEYSVLHMRE